MATEHYTGSISTGHHNPDKETFLPSSALTQINPFVPGGRFINHLFFNFLSLIKIKIKTVLMSKLFHMTTTTKLIIW